jgi:hypothetical protein
MFGSLATIAALACAAPLPVRDRPAESAKLVLLAKGKDYFIHVAPLSPFNRSTWVWPEDSGIPGITRTVPSGSAVLHTSMKTGEMKVLAFGGSTVTHGPPMGIDRLYYHQVRLAGVAVDAERLWILEWRSEEVVPQFGPAQKGRDAATGIYHLLVFRAADGVLVHDLLMKEGDFPDKPPVESAEAGPMEVRGDEVSCFGVIFTFKGTELVKQQYRKKP